VSGVFRKSAKGAARTPSRIRNSFAPHSVLRDFFKREGRSSRAGWRAGLVAALAAAVCAFAFADPQANKCPDSGANCLKPVRFIAKGSCYVYACQYGTPKVRLINVEAKNKKVLDKLAAEDNAK